MRSVIEAARDALERLNPAGLQNELGLQHAIERALVRAGVAYAREVELLGPAGRLHGDRIDFLLGDVGLEVKVDGSRADVIRQLDRYAESDQVQHLLLVTTRAQHRAMPRELREKPLEVLYLCPLL